MTIFQKMLAVPVLALFLNSSFLFYSYVEYQHTTDKVKEIREQYLPLLEIASDNTHLFSQIRSIFKDAALSDEQSWLPNSKQPKQIIEQNFLLLRQNPNLVDAEQLATLGQSFQQYYDNAYKLAQLIINNQDNLIVEQTLVQNVERFHNDTDKQFSQLKQSIQQGFRQTLDDTNEVMNRLLLVGGVISIAIMLFILIITLAVSITTRNSVNQIIERMKGFALGSTDFSHRLQYRHQDELGYLIHWFNKLSDKLEQDYITLKTVSITDKLTQLNNRSRTDVYLPTALENAISAKQNIAVIMLDIDHFKKINDTYGHLVGDEVLKDFANILKNEAHEHDFIGRWGGEEFILIVSNTDIQKAKDFAENIRQKVANYDFGEVGPLTSSFGIALSREGDNGTSLLKRADDCLYKAKHQGRNCVVLAES